MAAPNTIKLATRSDMPECYRPSLAMETIAPGPPLAEGGPGAWSLELKAVAGAELSPTAGQTTSAETIRLTTTSRD